ncbi:MAG: class I SAM-dependent methyltransferase [Thermoplasmata archaeon]
MTIKENEFLDFEVETYDEVDEFIDKISGKIKDEFQPLRDKYHPANIGKDNAKLLYSLVREKKPKTVVETGVCNGLSSAVILKALDDNDKGKLYSVDLPAKVNSDEIPDDRTGAVIPPTKNSGWAVPDKLRSRWTLKIGDTFKQTPTIFKEEESIDIFIHDSDHSYEGMMFEFSLAWRHLKKEGLLLADNIDRNLALSHFAEGKESKKYKLGKMGLLKKD